MIGNRTLAMKGRWPILVLAVTMTAACSTSGQPTAISVSGSDAAVTTSVLPTTTAPEPPTDASTPAPPTAAPPLELAPGANGYVTVRTKSGLTKCQVAVNALICESGADTSWPFDSSGDRYNSFRVSSSGEIMWAQGNLGGAETFQMDYLTYHAVGWTIRAEMNGTTFTNDRTGHGAFVSLQQVQTF